MSIGTTITAPPPGRTTFHPSRGSPLNPSNVHRLHPHATTGNRAHLSNLDRLLLKQQEQPSQRPRHPINHENDVSDSGSSWNSGGRDGDSGNGAGGGLFNALNLNTIIPSLRNPATEAMSPKSLTKLQRLLSSPHPSPKNSIASRWRLYHGSDGWANLLDPLDENLRRELVRCGDLVQAVYHAFHSNPGAPPSRNRHVILPDRNYRVTRSLYATSSVELPRWLDGVAPWMTQRSSWIGYVAVCDNQQEINRMGRRDIVISLRGTSTCMEWAENVRAGLVPMDGAESAPADPEAPKVANGFYSLYKTRGEHVPSLSEIVLSEVRRLVELYKGEELSITVTGHSLGAALALFVADDVAARVPNAPPVAVFSFGGPRVGNRAFADRLEAGGVKVLRVVNANDVITRVPAAVPHVLEGYVHVGSELRVDSRASPYLRPDADPNCCHDLESYLHLVDGFMGSDCPFRSDAKRSLAKLLRQQRPNLKRLYVNQADMMGLNRCEPAVLASPSHANGYLASPSA